MTEYSELVGYARLSATTNNVVKLNINKDAFAKAKGYTGQDGEDYVSLAIPKDKLRLLINGQREVTGILHLPD